MKHPLGIVVVLYTAGLLLGKICQPPLAGLFGLSLTLAVAALFLSRLRRFLVWPLVVLTGWTNIVRHTVILSPHDLRKTLGDEAALVALRGTLHGSPDERATLRNGEASERTLAQLDVGQIQSGSGWQPAAGRVVVFTRGALPPDFFSGEQVEINGVLSRPPAPVAPGLFDYRAHLESQGIYFQLKVQSSNDWKLLAPRSGRPWSDRFRLWAKTTLSRGLPKTDEPLRLLWAMTLGWRSALTNEIYEPFMQSGTMHIFAVSGLHVALIAGILVALLRTLQVGRVWCGIVVIPLLWFYTAATGWQSSAIRATLMMSIIIAGWALKRPSNLLNSLAAAAFIILLWDPRQLFQASFQLSFCVVLSIGLLMPPLERLRDRWLATDPLLPPALLPGWRRALTTVLRWLATTFAISLAAWLGSLPLTAYYFHLFSPVTLLANLVIVPLSSAALAACMGSLLCGSWLPWVGELFNHSAWFWMWLIQHLSETATELPGAYWYVTSPPVWSFGVYYILLVGALSGWLFRPRVRRWAVAAGGVVLTLVLWHWWISRDQVELTVLPLNGGHAVFVDSPGKANDWLVDCGRSNSVQFVMTPFLHAHGINRLPQLVLSHGDLQHVGGALLLRNTFHVGKVFTSPMRFRSAVYRRILKTLDRTSGAHGTVARGDHLGCWTVLHPEGSDHFPKADDAGLVLLGQFHSIRVLLLADLGQPGQEALIERTPDLRADIVVTGLPDEGEALGQGLLEAIKPRLIVVADSEFPATRRAKAELLNRLRRTGIPVLSTREVGAVTIMVTDRGWTVAPDVFSQQPQLGDHLAP